MRTGRTGRARVTPSPSRTPTWETSSKRPTCRPTRWPIGTEPESGTSAKDSSAYSGPDHRCPYRTRTRPTRRPRCGSTTPVRRGFRYGNGVKPPTRPVDHG
ncbi:ORFC2 [Zebra finch circovirus]|uniref:ORFC2 n=1 Tax=Zebra finch circovirus TaxID=1642515 RepID=A0A142LXV5_9CIRC|nr:ORFC2 [Zebra finch circovirus]